MSNLKPTLFQINRPTLPHIPPRLCTWSVCRMLTRTSLCVCALSHSDVSDSLQSHGPQPTRLLCPWICPGKNTGVGCHALLLGIFPTQGLNLHLLYLSHCRQILWQLSRLGSPVLILPVLNHLTCLISYYTSHSSCLCESVNAVHLAIDNLDFKCFIIKKYIVLKFVNTWYTFLL